MEHTKCTSQDCPYCSPCTGSDETCKNVLCRGPHTEWLDGTSTAKVEEYFRNLKTACDEELYGTGTNRCSR